MNTEVFQLKYGPTHTLDSSGILKYLHLSEEIFQDEIAYSQELDRELEKGHAANAANYKAQEHGEYEAFIC